MAKKAVKRQSKRVGWIDIPDYGKAKDTSFPGPDRHCGFPKCAFMVRFDKRVGWHHVGSVKSDKHHMALPGSHDSYWDGDHGLATDLSAANET